MFTRGHLFFIKTKNTLLNRNYAYVKFYENKEAIKNSSPEIQEKIEQIRNFSKGHPPIGRTQDGSNNAKIVGDETNNSNCNKTYIANKIKTMPNSTKGTVFYPTKAHVEIPKEVYKEGQIYCEDGSDDEKVLDKLIEKNETF
jgi:hypothetical protein